MTKLKTQHSAQETPLKPSAAAPRLCAAAPGPRQLGTLVSSPWKMRPAQDHAPTCSSTGGSPRPHHHRAHLCHLQDFKGSRAPEKQTAVLHTTAPREAALLSEHKRAGKREAPLKAPDPRRSPQTTSLHRRARGHSTLPRSLPAVPSHARRDPTSACSPRDACGALISSCPGSAPTSPARPSPRPAEHHLPAGPPPFLGPQHITRVYVTAKTAGVPATAGLSTHWCPTQGRCSAA